MPSVFLCHSSEDKPLVEPMQLALASAGCQVFYDEQSLPPGGDYHARIRAAVNSCDLFVFVASPASITAGKFTLTELKFARERWPTPVNRVLPVAIGGLKPSDLPNYLQAATVLTVSGNAAAEVRHAVEAMLHELEPKRPKRLAITLASVGVALGLSFGVYRYFHSKPPPAADTPPKQQPMQGEIKFESDPEDYVGDGKTLLLSDKNGLLSARLNDGAISIYFEGDDSWSLDFAAPRGKQLTQGRYEGAQRYPFNNPLKPGFSVSGAGRACNELDGEFVVKKIVLGASELLKELELEFKQRCDHSAAELRGVLNLKATD
jgi:hypothetical protein